MPTTKATVRVKRLRAVARGTTVVNNVGTYVDVQDDDVTIATNVDTINVTGSASVTDNGSGKVTINVSGGGISGILLKDEGSSVGTFATLNVTGDATVTDAGSGVATLNVSGGGISGILLKDEGTSVGTFATVNVTGAATLSDAGSGVATLNVTGGISGFLLKDSGSSVGTFATINVTGAASVTDAGSGVATLDVSTLGAQDVVPLASDFPTTVLGGGSTTDTASALVLKANGHGASFDVQQVLQSAPSSPWARYYKVELNSFMKAYLYGGFIIRRSSSGAFVSWVIVSNGTSLTIEYWEFASATSRATYTNLGVVEASGVYLKIEDDGTNFVLSASPTGVAATYVPFHTVSKTAYLASYDQIGFGADAFNNAIPNHDCYMAIEHFSSSAPTFGAAASTPVSHATMSNLAWTVSGHTGTASKVAGFGATGEAVEKSIGTTAGTIAAGDHVHTTYLTIDQALTIASLRL